MTELTNAPGWYAYTFATVDGEEYVWIADGDPDVSGQLPATGRYVRGAISGTTVARQEVDIPAILVDTGAIEPLVTANLDATVSSRATQADILSDATPFAGANVDAAISSRSSHSAADVDTVLSASHGAGSWETLDDTAVLAAIAALNDLSIADVQTAMTNQGYTVARAAALDLLDASIVSTTNAILAAVAALNDLSQADVQAAMTTQGYTVARAALIDNLDASISSVLAAIAALNDPDAAAIADAVWSEVLAAHETTSGSAAEAVAALRNRIRIDFTAGPPRELVVYDQAGTTELYRAPVTTTNGPEVLALFGVQHERGTPV